MANMFLESLGTLNQFVVGETARVKQATQKKKAESVVTKAAAAMGDLSAGATMQEISSARANLIAEAANQGVLGETLPTITALVDIGKAEATSIAMANRLEGMGLSGDALLVDKAKDLIDIEKSGERAFNITDKEGYVTHKVFGRDGEEKFSQQISMYGSREKLADAMRLAGAKARYSKSATPKTKFTGKFASTGDLEGKPMVEIGGVPYIQWTDKNGEVRRVEANLSRDLPMTSSEMMAAKAELKSEAQLFTRAQERMKQSSGIVLQGLYDAGFKGVDKYYNEESGRLERTSAGLEDLFSRPRELQKALDAYIDENDSEHTRAEIGGLNLRVPYDLKSHLEEFAERKAILDATEKKTTSRGLSKYADDVLGNMKQDEYEINRGVIEGWYKAAADDSASPLENKYLELMKRTMIKIYGLPKGDYKDWVNLDPKTKRKIMERMLGYGKTTGE